ncbi:hypothetical protein LTR91_010414 [Friedmanniomyces endolithicus]|uniref:Derlin n=1 Tax=Friedmanniomyces endolithicus TaxID=329885 RepID=A0AAN6FXM5_9PEZI|nr:hypothetical protein LTS09_013410 [Friedmanniomyces endolithicus]KAK0291708.1 hypothetical protein LTR35_001136 [Friedmanniomyces endolithicus]KAK0296619.1 hypothetical protein LTS00_004944 [Friedmanniomyces endolithicus]KAK0304082.1 hypothetical protein LTR01_007699 [Friedmanniomyces endolithicus]KAK0324767.1 hypothetical protein LTR82_004472 [Friedmanniomyces endolithicus]
MSAMDMFWAAPPVSRTITAAAVLLSTPTWMGLVNPYYVVFLREKLFTFTSVPQIWRLVTPFILTGPKLGLLLDPYFLYTYGSQLELEASRFTQPGDFFMYLVFVATVILLLGGVWLQGILLLSPLTLALAYTAAQENPNRQLTYFIVTFSAKWMPYAMLAMTFVMASPQEALLQSTGLIAAHAYDFVTKIWPEYGGGRKYLSTPLTVQRWFAKPGGTSQTRGAGTAFAARPANVPQQQTGGGGGWASGFSGGARGGGRRLGGD